MTPLSVPDVLTHLDQVQKEVEDPIVGSLGAKDGIACFNHLYRTITADVLAKLKTSGWFEDNGFISALDVHFAKRYFSALSTYLDGKHDKTPRCWSSLFRRRDETHISPIQFAVAGVNAHVNFDLPFALVTTCEALGVPFGDESQRRDYQKINRIFAENMDQLRHHYEDHLIQDMDRSGVAALNDWLDDLTVVFARDVAWEHAEHLWSVRSETGATRRREEALDLAVSLASRSILVQL